MTTIRVLLNHNIRRWINLINRILGTQLEPSSTLVAATCLILLAQLTIYLLLSSPQNTPCLLANAKFYNRLENDYDKLPTIYVITPTYDRYVQKAELTRLSHSLLLVPKLHWILVEDSSWPTDLVTRFVRRLRDEFNFYSITHLQTPTPIEFKLKPGEPKWKRPKGIWQRNRALDWIKENLDELDNEGVIYFADDDNTYDLELFNEIRRTKRVSVWPVAFAGGLLVEKPIVVDNKVQSFNSMWKSSRAFPIDMAGFSISLMMFRQYMTAKFSENQPIGYVESNFLSQFRIAWSELEPLAENCTKVMVWHTQTQNPALHEEIKLTKPSNSDMIW